MQRSVTVTRLEHKETVWGTLPEYSGTEMTVLYTGIWHGMPPACACGTVDGRGQQARTAATAEQQQQQQ
jgi:hypothetical protein